jgi:septal ring factor EnvC (AmiA/AmiB activator)
MARALFTITSVSSMMMLSVALPVSAGAQAPPTLDALDAQIAAASAELERASAERDRVGVEIDGLVAQRAAAQRRLEARVSVLTRVRRAGLLPLAAGLDALLRHQARVERLERMAVRDATSLRSLESRVAALRGEGARLAGEAERSEATVETLRERRATLERATLGLWAGLPPEADAPPQGQWSDGWGLRLSDGSAAGARFAELRGSLPMPVAGSAQLREAEREGGGGVELAASPGARVRAVAAGRVAYAAMHPAYGLLVIVDHGEGYYSVYGGLGALAASVGASVERDTPIGATGAGAVFFQVRRGTRPLPTREWLGI